MRKIIIMCSTIIGIIILMSIGSFIYYKHTYEESVIYDASSDIIQIFINNSDDFDEFVSKFYGHHLWSDITMIHMIKISATIKNLRNI